MPKCKCQTEPAGEVRSLPPIGGGGGGGELPKFILNLEHILNYLEFEFHLTNLDFMCEMTSKFDQTHLPQAFEGCER